MAIHYRRPDHRPEPHHGSDGMHPRRHRRPSIFLLLLAMVGFITLLVLLLRYAVIPILVIIPH